MHTLSDITEYLLVQDIVVEPLTPKNSFVDTKGSLKGTVTGWSKIAVQLDGQADLAGTLVESMSLASMCAVHMLEARPEDRVLDVCAAPGMKGYYLNKLVPHLQYYANDLSQDRLFRLRRLFTKHDVEPAGITKCDARFIDSKYDTESFDKIIIDAPCSGEGVILAGNDKLLATWSPAKVKRLQQLQIKILKSSWKLLKPGGRLVYATCTLNKNENERVVKKALGITLQVEESQLSTKNLQLLKNGMAWRILPSANSIGFFVAVLDKPDSETVD